MNTSALIQTRWACRIARWSSALTEDGSAVPGKWPVHVQTCVECQKFFAASATLEAQLRSAAGEREARPADGFEARILRGVRLGSPAARPTVRLGHPLIPLAGMVAGVALAVILLGRIPSHPAPESRPVIVQQGAPGSSTPSTPWTWSLPEPLRVAVNSNPLQNELDSVYSDAQSALNFLALNFLPTAPAGPIERESSRAVHSG